MDLEGFNIVKIIVRAGINSGRTCYYLDGRASINNFAVGNFLLVTVG